MFSDRTSFEEYHLGVGETCDYDTMRAEVAHAHFDGNVHFTITDMWETFSPSAAHGTGFSHLGAAEGHLHGHGHGADSQ